MSTALSRIDQQSKPRRRGRPQFYGVPTIQFAIYLPAVGLKERLEDEALARNVRDRTPERPWTVSRVIVDILLTHFDIAKPSANPTE